MWLIGAHWQSWMVPSIRMVIEIRINRPQLSREDVQEALRYAAAASMSGSYLSPPLGEVPRRRLALGHHLGPSIVL